MHLTHLPPFWGPLFATIIPVIILIIFTLFVGNLLINLVTAKMDASERLNIKKLNGFYQQTVGNRTQEIQPTLVIKGEVLYNMIGYFIYGMQFVLIFALFIIPTFLTVDIYGHKYDSVTAQLQQQALETYDLSISKNDAGLLIGKKIEDLHEEMPDNIYFSIEHPTAESYAKYGRINYYNAEDRNLITIQLIKTGSKYKLITSDGKTSTEIKKGLR